MKDTTKIYEKEVAKVIAFDREKPFTPNVGKPTDTYHIVEELSCARVKAIDDYIIKQFYEAYKDTDISKLFIIDETEFAKYLKATLPQYLKGKTEKNIYDFVKKKLDHTDKILRHKEPNGTGLSVLELIATREAYEEVLNFIGTIRTKGE